MPLYTKNSLELLRQRIDLADVLGSYIELKRTGASYKALCPFHDEKSPSFVVQKGDSHYHCFGCGAHGDAIQFLMTHQRLSFSEAVESLAQRFQVILEKIDKEDHSGPDKGMLKQALSYASSFYHFFLLHTEEGHNALNYLYQRGITLSFIKTFHLGFAPKQPNLLRKVLHGKFIKDEVMMEAGLLALGREGGGYRDFFYDRITIPIKDAAGAVIGFTARKYKEETFGGKYVNTPETPLFKKSRVLFGLNYSRRRIAKERKAIIVEGQLDALRLIENGFNITVAGQGTAFGDSHAKELIALGVNQVFLALDSDDAGQEAIAKIGNLFQKEGVEVLVLKMPAGEDPDSFLRKNGAEGFLKLMETGIDYLTFLVGHRSKFINIDSPAGKNELVRLITTQIKEWTQPLMVHESLRKLAQLLKIPENIIDFSHEIPNVYLKKTASLGRVFVDVDRVIEGDVLVWMLVMLHTHPHLFSLIKLNLENTDFHVPDCKILYDAILTIHEHQKKWDLFDLIATLDEEGPQQLVRELLQKKINRDRADEQLLAGIQKLLDRNWMEKREAIKIKIQSGESTDDEVWELVKIFDELKKNPPKAMVPS